MVARDSLATARWRAIGTDCALMVRVDGADPEEVAGRALGHARRRVDELDAACSRFRGDSELMMLLRGTTVALSPTLSGALAAALRTAERTDALVDPTVGSALRDTGYDADLEVVRSRPDRPDRHYARPAPGYRRVFHDPLRRLALIPADVDLDFGASAKAWFADTLAAELLERVIPAGGGVLVNLGGDVAIAGVAPADSWRLRVDHGSDDDPVISVASGGVATSSTVLRTWRQGGEHRHHIVDPRNGRTASRLWRSVTVAARSCELANAASTAAIVVGTQAPRWLAARGVHARLTCADGSVQLVGGWPAAAA